MIPKLKYESPKFLNKMSFFLFYMHFYNIGIDYEYRPNRFNAAALLLYR